MRRTFLIMTLCCTMLLFGCQNLTLPEDVIAKFRDYKVTISDIEPHHLTLVNKEKAKSRIIWYMIYEHALLHGYSPDEDLNTVVSNYISNHTPHLADFEEGAHRDAITDLMGDIYEQYADEVVWNGAYQF